MKRFLYLMFCATLFAVACEPDSTPVVDTSNSVLTLTSQSVLHYEAEGGHALITYTLENPVDGVKVEATSNVDWLTDFYIVDGQISFYVEASTVEQMREGMVLVTYDKHSFTVGVKQAAYVPMEVTLNDCVLNGRFNNRDSMSGTIFNYTVLFSDNGLTSAEDDKSSSYVYRINIYSENIHGFVVDRLPNGEYPFDERARGTLNSFIAEGSGYTLFGGEEPTTYRITGGKVVVTDDGIQATLCTEDGRTHNIVYTGSKELSFVGANPNGSVSTLTEELNVDLELGYIRCYYYGDDFGLGYDYWSISVIEDISSFSGMYILCSLLVDKSKGYKEGAFLGEYKAYNVEMGDNYANTFIPGDMFGSAAYSWYVECNQGYIDSTQPSAPISKGTITITDDESGVSIIFDCEDDAGHKIKGRVHNHSFGEIYDVRDPQNPKPGFN